MTFFALITVDDSLYFNILSTISENDVFDTDLS